MLFGPGPRLRQTLRLGVCLGLLGLASSKLGAHPAWMTSAVATIERDGRVRVTVRFDALAFALNDSSARVPDNPMNALLDGPREELVRRLAEAAGHFRRHFHVMADGCEIPIAQLLFPTVDSVWAWKAEQHVPRLPVLQSAVVTGQLPAGASRVAFIFPEIIDTVVLTVERPGEEAWTEPLAPGASSRELVIALPTSAGPEPWRGLLAAIGRFVALGFAHILPRGLDHVLFVAGLFLLGTRLPALMWQVTVFTLAHSVTLALSFYGMVRLPPAVIEPLIAISIVLVAVDNMRSAELRWWRLPVVFAFGLVHGMGFAGILQDLGLPRRDFLGALIGFNLGVELGQLTVIALSFLVVGWFRKHTSYRRLVVVPSSAAIGLIAIVWTVCRVW